MLSKVAKFLLDALCDLKPDGTPGKASFARVSLALVLAFSLGWVTAILWHSKFTSMPDLTGIVGFVSAWGGLVYAPSKFIAAWQNRGQDGGRDGR